MPKFVVRVGYEWISPCYRDVEIDATSETEAAEKALAESEADASFWTESIECDGEASATTVIEIRGAEE